MSDAIDLAWIGRTLREMQADMRTIRSENALLQRELAGKASRDEVLNVLAVLSDRIAAFEARMERRFDQTERSLDERLTGIETKLSR
jgi:hypothetical protein